MISYIFIPCLIGVCSKMLSTSFVLATTAVSSSDDIGLLDEDADKAYSMVEFNAMQLEFFAFSYTIWTYQVFSCERLNTNQCIWDFTEVFVDLLFVRLERITTSFVFI